MNGEAMIDFRLEHLFSYAGALANPPEIFDWSPDGIRVNFYSAGGEMTGSRIRGKLRPIGDDWMMVRKDGVALLDVRTTLETHDGAWILATYHGLIDLGEEAHDRILRDELPSLVQLRIAPRFFTSHPEYLWLNRLHCIGIGEYRATANEVNYDVYAMHRGRRRDVRLKHLWLPN